jgi:hypothetical protein
MRNLKIVVALLVMVLAAATVPWPGAGGVVVAAGAPADPELGPMICGTSSYVDGTFVWTDYAYDDRGPNEDPDPGDETEYYRLAGGDATYPEFAAPGNAADLIQLQIGVQGDGLHLLAILETLVNPDFPILGVAFDTDANPATGAALLPDAGHSWPASGSLGVEQLVVVSSEGAKLWTYAGQTWSASAPFDATVDKDLNVMKTVVPNNLLDTPEEGTWRVFGVLGIRNAAGGSWLDGSEAIYDLAFVGDEPFLLWQEYRQADILAGRIDAAEAAAMIDFAKMADQATELATPSPGWNTFLYHSRLRLPEGVQEVEQGLAAGGKVRLGPYPPYMVFVPENLPTPSPLTVFLHGLTQNHLQATWSSGAYIGSARPGTEDPYLVGTLFQSLPYPPANLTVYPFGFGEALYWEGIAEQDALDVLADITARFEIDPDRVTLMGSSMGGIGTFRLGVLYPDRWAAIFPLIGKTRGGIFDQLDNLANVPVRQINGALDFLIPQTEATMVASRLDELGYEYRFWLVTNWTHEYHTPIVDCVLNQTVLFQRNPNPARVVYSVDAKKFNVDPALGLDLRYDGAYWVNGIVVRDDSQEGTVDVTSLAIAERQWIASELEEAGDGTTDLCGNVLPEEYQGVTWTLDGRKLEPGDPQPTSNVLNAVLTNVGSVAFDLQRAGISAGEECTINVDTDSAVAITLKGLHRNAGVVLEGELLATTDTEGQATVELPVGDHELMVTHATFVLSDLTINPDKVKVGETVQISVKVTNSSIVPGTYNVVLKLDGTEIDSKDVTLEGGASETVSFTVTREESGTYGIEIDGLSGNFRVSAPAVIDWPLIGGIIGGVIVIAAAVVVFLRSRRAVT